VKRDWLLRLIDGKSDGDERNVPFRAYCCDFGCERHLDRGFYAVSNWTTRNTGTTGPQGPYQPDYDSGRMNTSTKTGQYFNIIHNLNSADLIVDITGKTQTDGEAYQRYFFLTGYVPWMEQDLRRRHERR
jgi:hypothetical protein